MKSTNSESAEILAKWYLRFNGYFIVDNFIIHAGEDPERIYKGVIGNYTEVDTLGLRYLGSQEVSGVVRIMNDAKLSIPGFSEVDFVITEVKTGNQNTPNSIWKDGRWEVVAYILRFAGFIKDEDQIEAIAKIVIEKQHFQCKAFSIRLVVISDSILTKKWQHLCHIPIKSIIDFIVDVRGRCWQESGLGIASSHPQWHPLIIHIFKIANDFSITEDARKKQILLLLQS